MNTDSIHATVSEAMQMPQLIRLEKNLIIAQFKLMKLVPAKYIVEQAWAEEKVGPDQPIVETSSGTFALGLGIVCAELGIPFVIFCDPVVDRRLKGRLEELGGRVHIVSALDGQSNVQSLRMKALRAYLDKNPGAYWTRQYDNFQNQESYKIIGDYLAEHIDGPMTLVGTVGSGGSTCGITKRLRALNREVRLIGVDTFGSVLFGHPLGKRVLRGLGNSLHPKNLQCEYFDEVHWVHAKDAFLSTRELHAKKSVFGGPTTGAAYQVARWVSQSDRDRPVVFIAADEGYRYQSTIYDDKWLENLGFLRKEIASQPEKVGHPNEAMRPWAYINWGRRTYNDMLGENTSET